MGSDVDAMNTEHRSPRLLSSDWLVDARERERAIRTSIQLIDRRNSNNANRW